MDALFCSFLSKTSDSGPNTPFLAMTDALFCSCLIKASDSDSKLLCLASDSLSHSLLILIVPSGSNCLLRISTNGLPLTNRVTTNTFGFLNIYRCRAQQT